MPTRLVSIGIALFWLAMMTSLLVSHILPERRQARSSLLEPEVLAMQWMDLYDWSWVRQNARTVGAMTTQIEKLRRPGEDSNLPLGYIAVQNAEVNLNLFGLTRNVRFKMTLRLDPAFHVADFAALIASSALVIECDGFVDANDLYFRLAPQAGEPVYRSIRLRQPISLIEAVRPLVAKHFDLRVGEEFRTDVVDPLFGMNHGQVTIRVAGSEELDYEGEKTRVFRLDQTFEGITKSSWVTDRGITLRRELIQGYMLEKSNKPEVRDRYPDLATVLRIPDMDKADFKARTRLTIDQPPAAVPQFNVFSLLVDSPTSRPGVRPPAHP